MSGNAPSHFVRLRIVAYILSYRALSEAFVTAGIDSAIAQGGLLTRCGFRGSLPDTERFSKEKVAGFLPTLRPGVDEGDMQNP